MTTKTINVELPIVLYKKLKRMQQDADCTTWVSFFQKIASQDIDIFFEILSVNDKSPEDHKIEFKIGDYVYRYEQGAISLVSSPKAQQIKISLMSKLGG